MAQLAGWERRGCDSSVRSPFDRSHLPDFATEPAKPRMNSEWKSRRSRLIRADRSLLSLRDGFKMHRDDLLPLADAPFYDLRRSSDAARRGAPATTIIHGVHR